MKQLLNKNSSFQCVLRDCVENEKKTSIIKKNRTHRIEKKTHETGPLFAFAFFIVFVSLLDIILRPSKKTHHCGFLFLTKKRKNIRVLV